MSAISDVWDKLWKGERETPTAVTIPAENVEGQEKPQPFRRNNDYFQIIINELFLAASRKWFTAIDPLVFVLTDFTYDSKSNTVPFLVGPGSLKGLLAGGVAEPAGMIYRNTRVAGVHPYRGGKVSIALILCQAPVNDDARRLINVVEGAAHALDFSTALMPYVKIGQVVLQGFNSILGLNTIKPLIGWRGEFDREGGTPFTPGFFALINEPDVDPRTLWVKDGRLYRGATAASATELRSADFVLFSVVKPPDGNRSDLELLPFWKSWQRVEREASVANADAWKMAKVSMSSLDLELRQSPDLTEAQAEAIADDFIDKMTRIQQRAVKLGQLSDEKGPTASRTKALSILEM
ncbi:MAG TPA: hypothetical protein VF021_04220 [Longimicrobiales bacterium]